MKKYLLAIFIFFGIMFVLYSWYDEQLFTSTSSAQKPFVVILMDTSATMNNVVFYPIDGINGAAPGTGYDPYKSGGYSGTISTTNFDDGDNMLLGDEVAVTNFGDSIESGFYFGFKVINTSTTKSISSADFKGQVIADRANSIQISQTTYNWVPDPNGYWIVGKTSGAYAKVTGKSRTGDNNNYEYWFAIESKGGTFPDNNSVFTANEMLYCYTNLAADQVLKRAHFYSYPSGSSEALKVRYKTDYLKWLMLYATNSGETAPYGQLQQTSYFHKYGTFDTSVVAPNLPTVNGHSNCNCPAIGDQKLVAITRIQAGREAMCNITRANWGKIIPGIFKFSSDGTGGEKVENLNNNSSPNEVLKSIYDSTSAGTFTPLAAALADVWAYFRPQGGSQPTYWPTGWGSDGVWHGYDPSVSTAGFGPGGLNPNPCSHFYTIVVTDGQSTNDTFADSRFNNSIFKSSSSKIKRDITKPTINWEYINGWGDYDSHDPTLPTGNQPTFFDYCTDTDSCWVKSASGNDYFDDVAYLLSHSDMLPDSLYAKTNDKPKWTGDQNIITHVVGFNVVNDMLKEAAANGMGQFFTASNYEDLSAALQSAINQILLREEQMMYNVFASPKQAVTAKTDLFGFKGTFIPQNGKTLWQGHLKCYQLLSTGDFPDESLYKWDASDKITSTLLLPNGYTNRKVYTFKYANEALTDSSNAFNSTNIIPINLGLAADDLTGLTQVVNFIRGDNLYDFKLGDIFHFNPIVVGSPLPWKGQFDASYQTFYTTNKDRKEVVYIGTNDGMLHCIQVQAGGDVTAGGTELWGFIPPSHLLRVKNLALTSALDLLSNVPPNCDPSPCSYGFDRYFVDGKAMVKDMKIAGTWKTVLIFGMGIGGKHYCALDVSDPENPKFLWEFTDDYMGYTEAKPIIADINDGTSTYPAVIIPAGYDYWEKPATTSDLTSWTGKGLYVLKVAPNSSYEPQLVKKFIFTRDGIAGETTESGVAVRRIDDFIYPFAAAPALFDQNRDGIYDYMYACDTGDYRSGQSGGRIWKINIGDAPATWVPQKIFQSLNRQNMFLSPTLGYDLDWNLWVFVGTGRRSQITANIPGTDLVTGLPTYIFTNPPGQFYAFMDEPLKKSFTYPFNMTNSTDLARLKDITSFFTGTPTDAERKISTTTVGIYFDYFKQSPEVIFEPTPIFIDNTLTMNTYSPEAAVDNTTIDPVTGLPITPACGSSSGFSGKHFVYQFTLGRIGTSLAITSTNVFGGKILGSGVLSSGKYIIYYGSQTPGFYTVTGRETPSLEDLFGTILWKEDKQ